MTNTCDNILEFNRLCIGYKSNKKQTILINDISTLVKKGELIALIGRNGSGKSSLLRTIIGLIPSIYGDIKFNKLNLNNFTPKKLAKIVSYVSTEKIYIPNAIVKDVIALGRGVYLNWYGKLTKKDIKIIDEAIKLVGIEHLKNKNILQISDGERQRVMIARAIAQDTDIIILDEPTAFLDLQNRFMIFSILKKLTKEKNKTIIFSTHDLENTLNSINKIWFIHNKNLTALSKQEFIKNNLFDIFLSGTDLSFDKTDNKIKLLKNL